MLPELLFIPLCAVANRLRGIGYKLHTAIGLGAIYGGWLFYKGFTWKTSLIAAAIIISGWYIANAKGTGFGFNAIHGWTASKSDGREYMSLRGLLRLPMTITLAVLFNVCWLAPLGLLGLSSGLWYRLAGKMPIAKVGSVTIAEILDGAFGYGLILTASLWLIY